MYYFFKTNPIPLKNGRPSRLATFTFFTHFYPSIGSVGIKIKSVTNCHRERNFVSFATITPLKRIQIHTNNPFPTHHLFIRVRTPFIKVLHHAPPATISCSLFSAKLSYL